MSGPVPKVTQFDVVVSDMAAAVAFYRALGFEVEHDNPDHVEVKGAGISLELDSAESVPGWNGGWRGGMGVLGLGVPSRQDVDDRFAAMAEAGYRSQQEPFDAPWGRRYAVLEDPDGNAVGLMSAD